MHLSVLIINSGFSKNGSIPVLYPVEHFTSSPWQQRYLLDTANLDLCGQQSLLYLLFHSCQVRPCLLISIYPVRLRNRLLIKDLISLLNSFSELQNFTGKFHLFFAKSALYFQSPVRQYIQQQKVSSSELRLFLYHKELPL